MIEKTLVFVDGENLVLRYQDMISQGRKPKEGNVYERDCFVWNNAVFDESLWNIKRLSYYTSVVGDDERINDVRRKISDTKYTCTTDKQPRMTSTKTGQIVPFIKKKSSRSRKESICDIAISVDVMRACYRDHAGIIWIFSGDGDFIQLINEVVHTGKSIYVSAFSSGLNSEIPYVVDEFSSLDRYFFYDE